MQYRIMKLCGNYYIEADSYNFILLYDKGKGPKMLGYYTSMMGVLRAVLRHAQRMSIKESVECNTEYVALLTSKLDDMEQFMSEAVASIKEVTPKMLAAYEKQLTKATAKDSCESDK